MTSATQVPDDDQLARYLLGELSGQDEESIDDAIATDDGWQAVQRVENDLLDAYVRDELADARRLQLAQRIATSPRLRERLAFHHDMRTVATARRRRAIRRKQRAVVATIGACLAAAVALLVVFRGGGETKQDQIVALTLDPTTRGADAPTVRLPARGTLAVTAVMDAEEIYPSYRVRITSAGKERWSLAKAPATDGAIVLHVPASALGEGAHELEITGLPSTGEPLLLGTRSFRIVR